MNFAIKGLVIERLVQYLGAIHDVFLQETQNTS